MCLYGSILLRNLKAYKDSAVVFSTEMPDIDFPDDKRGNPNIPQWHVNYPPPPVNVTYEDFLCNVDGDAYDGDLNIHILLDNEQLNPSASTFWTDGWRHDPNIIREKLYLLGNQLHIEVIMFGRTAQCSDDPNTYNDAPLLPGWSAVGLEPNRIIR